MCSASVILGEMKSGAAIRAGAQPLAGGGGTYSGAVIEAVEEMVRRADPLLLEAAEDCDLGLIRWFLTLTPEERMRYAASTAHTLRSARPVSRGSSGS
jgi:hypothetical protein